MGRIMVDDSYEMGMVGLGVMGRNLALNMVDKGFSVAGYDVDGQKADALEARVRRTWRAWHEECQGAGSACESPGQL